MSDDYEVGYGKPPKGSQFQKGQSGNPRGRRPKDERSITRRQIRRDILAVTEARIPSIVPGRSGTMTVFETALWKVAEQALKGDHRAMRVLFDLHRDATDEHAEANPALVDRLEEAERLHSEDEMDDLRGHNLKVFNAFRKLTRKV